MAWSVALSVAALGAIGLATSLFSGRGPVYSATRQVVIGAVAAAGDASRRARLADRDHAQLTIAVVRLRQLVERRQLLDFLGVA